MRLDVQAIAVDGTIFSVDGHPCRSVQEIGDCIVRGGDNVDLEVMGAPWTPTVRGETIVSASVAVAAEGRATMARSSLARQLQSASGAVRLVSRITKP